MLVIFNEGCSKCAALADELSANALDEGVAWTKIRYMEGELKRAHLDLIFALYQGDHADLVRTAEAAWTAGGHEMERLSLSELKDLILREPILLQRPIMIQGDQVILARRQDRVQAMLTHLHQKHAAPRRR